MRSALTKGLTWASIHKFDESQDDLNVGENKMGFSKVRVDLAGQLTREPGQAQSWLGLCQLAIDAHADLDKKEEQKQVAHGSVSRDFPVPSIVLRRGISCLSLGDVIHPGHISHVGTLSFFMVVIVYAFANAKHMMSVSEKVSCHGEQEHESVDGDMVLVSPDPQLGGRFVIQKGSKQWSVIDRQGSYLRVLLSKEKI